MNTFLYGVICLYAFAGTGYSNVMLLSVDTLRADFLGCYGCAWNTSPHIDGLAKKSLVFDDACCETPLTGPSFSAMLTSRYPRMVGATRNGMHIAEDAATVTEIFQNAGYYTFAVLSNWTLKGRLCGLDKGFEHYDDMLEERRWGVFNGERNAEQVTRAALERLHNRPPDKPFFAWIHYSDPHAPYHYHSNYSPVPRGLRTRDRTERVRVKYASEVAYTDYHIGKLIEALPPNTKLLFVADHGESLYEHGFLGHGRHVYQDCLHVPLFIQAPEVSPGRSAAPAQTMDVGPTLLALAGLPAAGFALGQNLLDISAASDRPRFMETYGGAIPRFPGAKTMLDSATPLCQAVLMQGWKLIQYHSGQNALYYLPDDRRELHNLPASQPSKCKELAQMLQEWNATHPKGKDNESLLSTEDLEALESLGYVN